MTGQAWGKVERPWGWEIRVNVLDGDRVVGVEMAQFGREPSKEQVAAAVAAHVERYSAPVEAPSPEPDIRESEVNALQAEVANLKVKLIDSDAKLKDAKAQLAAIREAPVDPIEGRIG